MTEFSVSEQALTGQERRRELANARARETWARLSPEERAVHRAKGTAWARRCARGETGPKLILSVEQRVVNRATVRKATQLRNRMFADHYKSQHPCVDCGYSDIRALQFDHRDRGKKLMAVSDLVKRASSIERIKIEIAKCDVRCANCHFIRSAEEQHHMPLARAA